MKTHKGSLGEGEFGFYRDGDKVDLWIKDWQEPGGRIATHTMTVKKAIKLLNGILKELTEGKD